MLEIEPKKFKNFGEYFTYNHALYTKNNYKEYPNVAYLEKVLRDPDNNLFFCPVCLINSKIRIDNLANQNPIDRYVYLNQINWNYIFCCNCGKNTRQRLCLYLLDRLCFNTQNLNIYLVNEIRTDVFDFCINKYPSHTFITSEYDTTNLKENVRIEDVHNLNFDDNIFDIVVCQDVFEHVADPLKGLSEIFRVLKPGGQMLMTLPSNQNILYEHTKYAEIINEEIVYYRTPEYHDYSLVYNLFGLKLLEELREIGFSDVTYEVYSDLNLMFFLDTPIYRVIK